jgi:hypothetical protein
MSRETSWLYFIALGSLGLVALQLIRIRLKKQHVDLFLRMGSPAFFDSNYGRTYWRFQKFVWWEHRFEVSDVTLRSLCILACAAQVGAAVFAIVLLLTSPP